MLHRYSTYFQNYLDEKGFEPLIFFNMSIFKIDTLNHSATHLKIEKGIEPLFINLQFTTLPIMLFDFNIFYEYIGT
jgi:hypothetical protein